MNINVKNIPLYTVYRFDINKYVMATKDGIEIYTIEDDGTLVRIANGKLVNKPEVYDNVHIFAIKDEDNDMIITFKPSIYIEEVGLDELYELREAIARNYRNKK